MLNRASIRPQRMALGLSCALMGGCAGAAVQAPHARGAGEWFVTMPETRSWAVEHAYGMGGRSLPEARVEPWDKRWLSHEPVHMKPVMRHGGSKRRAPAVTPVSEPEAPTQSAPPPAAPTPAAAPLRAEPVQLASAETSDVERYREREATSQAQQQFRGGNAIVIGAGTLILVLVIVLLILLLV